MERYSRKQGGLVKMNTKCYPIYIGVNTVGRSRTAVVNIKNLNVSQNQALFILVDDTDHFLVDMNSSNGTFLHDNKLIPFKLYKLTNNAQIKFGDQNVTYLKVSFCNATNIPETSSMEITQNLTQNFYACNTQLMDGDDSLTDSSAVRSTIVEDIHEMETQQVNFPPQLESNISNIDFKLPLVPEQDQGMTSNDEFNIHDAPTQVMKFPESFTILKELSGNTAHQLDNSSEQTPTKNTDLPNFKASDDKLNSQSSTETIILNNFDISEISNNTLGNGTRQSSLGPSISQLNGTYDDSLINDPKDLSSIQEREVEDTILEDTVAQNLTDHSSNDSVDLLAVEVSSDRTNEKNNNASLVEENAPVVESVSESEDNLVQNLDPNSNNSDDLLAEVFATEAFTEENKENIESSVKRNSQVTECFSNSNKIPSINNVLKTDGSDSDTDFQSHKKSSQNSSQGSSIGKIRKKQTRNLPTSSDNDDSNAEVESTQDNCRLRKKILQKFQSDSESENENTQDIGVLLKKPLRKLDSDNEESTSLKGGVNSDSETDCEDDLDQVRQSLIQSHTASEAKQTFKKSSQSLADLIPKKAASDLNIEASSGSSKNFKKTSQEVLNIVMEKLDIQEINDDFKEQVLSPVLEIDHVDELKQIYQDKTNPEDQKGPKEVSLDDTDCIPATQDAFADAFNYTSEAGTSSSEDFRLGVTQFMEESANDVMSKITQQTKATNIEKSIESSIDQKNEDDTCHENVENPDDGNVYLMATQQISVSKTLPSSLVRENQEDEDAYLMATQPILETNTSPATANKNSSIYDLETQQAPENICSTQTEKDDDIYTMATQVVNTESQFKVPRSFTFKKKAAAVLHESLSSLLGNSNQDDDIFDAATQPVETHKSSEGIDKVAFEMPTQLISVTSGSKEDCNSKVDEFDAPTQLLPELSKPKEDTVEKDADNDIYLQPTQCLEPSTESEHQPSNSADENVDKAEGVDENPVEIQAFVDRTSKASGDVPDLLDMPKRVLILEPLECDNSQKELEICNANVDSSQAIHRPTNPLAHVLNAENTREDSPKVPALRRSRRKSASPLPEPPRSKRLKNMKDSSKLPKVSEANPTETMSQIEDFVNKSEAEILSENRKQASCSKSATVENNEEDRDNIETLSQIEAFIKKPVIRTYSNKIASKRSTEIKKHIEGQSTNIKEEHEPITDTEGNISTKTSNRRTAAQEDIPNLTDKPEDIPAFNNSDVTGKSVSQIVSESEENQSYRNPNVKSDVDQSFALLESNARKSRKKIIDPLIQDFKVTVSSHRRSMCVAETSMVASRKTSRENIPATSTRSKRKIEADSKQNVTIASDSSDNAILNKKPARGKALKNSTANSEVNKTKREIKTEDNCEVINESRESSKRVSSTKVAMSEPGTSGTARIISKKSNEKTQKIVNLSGEKKKEDIKQVRKRDTEVMTILKAEETAASNNDDAVAKQVIEPATPVRGRRAVLKIKRERSLDRGTSSDSSVSTDVFSTPKKQRISPMEGLLNSAERAKRKLKPKVVFTMLNNPQLESLIRQLGGSIVDSVEACTVLVTERVKRSQKLLSAVGQGKPICSPQWIRESKKKGEFLDPSDFILTDEEAETKWNFSLKESINRATNQKLLDDYVLQIMTTDATDVLKSAIEACGGKCVSKFPGKGFKGNLIVIASSNQKNKYSKISKQNPNVKVVESEAIFDGVLRQELRLSKHLLT